MEPLRASIYAAQRFRESIIAYGRLCKAAIIAKYNCVLSNENLWRALWCEEKS